MSINFQRFTYDFTESPNFPTEYDDPNYLQKVRAVWSWCKTHNEKLSQFVVSLNNFSVNLNQSMDYIDDKADDASSYAEQANNSAIEANSAKNQANSAWNNIKNYVIPSSATYSKESIDEMNNINLTGIVKNSVNISLIRGVMNGN